MKRACGTVTKFWLFRRPSRDFLLPQRVLADHKRADILRHQQIDDASAGGMEVMVNPPRALVGEALQTPTVLPRQLALQLRAALVVELVDGIHWPPVDEARDKARLV